MSQAELERFAAAVQESPSVLDGYADLVTAREMAVRLRQDGYDVTDAEVEEAARKGGDLSDEQLDQIAGGLPGMILGTLVVGAVASGIILAAGVGVTIAAAVTQSKRQAG